MTLYLAVTADKYELPLYVAESRKEMALWSGLSVNAISCAISNYNRRRAGRCPLKRETSDPGRTMFVKIEVDDEPVCL